MRLSLLAACLLLPIAACAGEADDGPSPFDDDYPVSGLDPLIDGAPDNRSLPDENKADAVYPKQFDLVSDQSPVKSQGSRGVCSIFATTALMENLYIKAGMPNPDFSEQYMQWSTKEQVRQYRNTDGSNADTNLRAASEFGIVEERAWPYESQPWGTANDPACTGETRPVQCYTNGAPPAAAVEARKYKLPRGRWLNTNSIKAHLTSKKHGVNVGMTFFYQSWNHRRSALPVNTQYWRDGIVLYPNQADKTKSLEQRAGHAIQIVGWDDEKSVATVDEKGEIVKDADGNPVMETGFFLFKNSWGTGSFGAANPKGDGYGWLSYEYVHEYGTAYVSDVPTYAAPAETCDNGRDDDGDGLTDCDDSECAAHASCQAEPTSRTYSSTAGADIPDNVPAGVASTISVADTGTVGTVKVTLDITHPYRGDLKVVLAHAGRTITLHDQTGSYEDDLKLTLDVEGLDAAALAGAWTLTVSDNAAYDTGRLNAWSIEVVTR